MLPTAKTKRAYGFDKEKILLYGDWKTGKTQLVAALPFDVLFLATERGHGKVEAYVKELETWDDFKAACVELKTHTRFPMVAVDTIDALWYMFLKSFLAKHNVAYECDGALGYGKGFKMMVREFVQEFYTMQNIGKGFVLIAHETNWTDVDALGNDIAYHGPNLPQDKDSMIRDTICGLCDYIFYLTIGTATVNGNPVPNTRMIRTAKTDRYLAGGRSPLVDPIVLENGDPALSAKRIVNAYNLAAKQATEPKPAAKTATDGGKS